MKWWLPIVGACIALAFVPAQERWRVEIDNPSNLPVRVADLTTAGVIRVYAGQEGVLFLTGHHARRVLLVDTGERVFKTWDFNVDAAIPCWRLTLERQGWRPPRLDMCLPERQP